MHELLVFVAEGDPGVSLGRLYVQCSGSFCKRLMTRVKTGIQKAQRIIVRTERRGTPNIGRAGIKACLGGSVRGSSLHYLGVKIRTYI